jgi:hypothetical protein
MNSIMNSIVIREVFRENRKSASSLTVAGVCSTNCVKSILGVGLKVKESIKDAFR